MCSTVTGFAPATGGGTSVCTFALENLPRIFEMGPNTIDIQLKCRTVANHSKGDFQHEGTRTQEARRCVRRNDSQSCGCAWRIIIESADGRLLRKRSELISRTKSTRHLSADPRTRSVGYGYR